MCTFWPTVYTRVAVCMGSVGTGWGSAGIGNATGEERCDMRALYGTRTGACICTFERVRAAGVLRRGARPSPPCSDLRILVFTLRPFDVVTCKPRNTAHRREAPSRASSSVSDTWAPKITRTRSRPCNILKRTPTNQTPAAPGYDARVCQARAGGWWHRRGVWGGVLLRSPRGCQASSVGC